MKRKYQKNSDITHLSMECLSAVFSHHIPKYAALILVEKNKIKFI